MTSAPAAGPLVVVCLRHADPRPHVDPLTGAVLPDDRRAGPSAADAAALEHALRVAQVWSGEVLAVSAGPVAVESTLRTAAALGARVLRVPWEDGHGVGFHLALAGDEHALAPVLAAALRAVGEPALVLCGDRSADGGAGALAALLAHELGAAQALGLTHLEVRDDGRVVGVRRLDAGRRERVLLPRPAVCSVEAAGVRLRRASLPATLAAGRTPVPTSAPDTASREPTPVVVEGLHAYRPRARVVPPPRGAARDRLLELTGALAAHEPPTVVGPVPAPEAADILLGFLRCHGYLTGAEVDR